MSLVVYVIVVLDGGWAYRAGATISETYRTHDLARKAAEAAAREQRAPGETTPIQYETGRGDWREEASAGADRPQTDVKG